MSTFIYHTECPSCGSSDGRAIYDDGGSYCFVCNKYFKGDEEVNTKEFSNEEVQLEEVLDIQSPIRGISPRIFRIYSYGKTPSGVHVYNAYNIEGKVVAQKFRYPDKTFKWKGSVKEAVPFGLHLWRSGGQRITITEGELDALSVAEALGGKYPVISIVNGASGAKKELAKHIEFLNSYGEVVLAFDNDAPGRKATAEVATLFPPGKVKTINLGKYKDFNEVLQSEGKAGVLKYYYETRTYTPDGIISGSSLDFDAVVNIDTTKSYMTPFKGINDKLRGLRKGELVTFTAGSGIGKTTLVREIAYDLAVNQQLKIGWVALEENTQRSALGFMGIYLDTPVHLTEEREKVDDKQLREAFEKVVHTDKVYFYDHWGSLDSDNLISKLRFLAVAAEVDFIFLDHISIVISGQDVGNERQAIDNLMTALRSLAEETQVGICVISHLRRPQGDRGFENGTEIGLSHLRGSGGIAQLSDGVVAIERNQQAAEGSNIGTIRVLKNRYTGSVGKAGTVKYYAETGRLMDYEIEEGEFRDEEERVEEEDY